MAAPRRTSFPALAVLALAAYLTLNLFLQPSHDAFVPSPARASTSGVPQQSHTAANGAHTHALMAGTVAGFLAEQPAHANQYNNLLFNEVLPVSLAVSCATIWGIVLGFVLLRLQEAFPE